MAAYFTDREYGPPARRVEEIDERLWGGLYGLIETRLGDGSFGRRFPLQCPDGDGPCGCDKQAFERVLAAEIPRIELPISADRVPQTPLVLDLLQFCAEAVGEPIKGGYHPFFRHYHLEWDRPSGLAQFVSEVNRLFARNGVAFELTDEGQTRRLLPQPLANVLKNACFKTGDTQTDNLLEAARARIVLPKPEDRQDALEKLWDAFERLKTLESGPNKSAQAEALLDRVAAPGSKFRRTLGDEAAALTGVGNSFRIRHSETTQECLTESKQIDYLFTRMFAFMNIILVKTGRCR